MRAESSLLWELVRRFLLHGGNRFARLITWASFVGLALGVMVLTLVVSVMNGFDHELRTRLLQTLPHITVTDAQPGDWTRALRADQRVAAIHEYFRGIAAVSNRGAVQPISLYGVPMSGDGAAGAAVTLDFVGQHMTNGSLQRLAEGADGILLGEPLARYMGLAVGDPVVLVASKVSNGRVAPAVLRFNLVGLFEIGAEPDYNLAIFNIARADAQFGQLGNRGTQIQLHDALDAIPVAATVAATLGAAVDGVSHPRSEAHSEAHSEADSEANPEARPANTAATPTVTTWAQAYGELFQAVRLEKSMMFVLLLMVVAIATFNIVAGQVMVVSEKASEIAILRTMGAKRDTIRGIFLGQGVLISVVGTGVGLLFGLLLAHNINPVVNALEALTGMHLLDGSYFVEIPVQVIGSDLLLIALLAAGLCLISAWLPAQRALQVEPVQALH